MYCARWIAGLLRLNLLLLKYHLFNLPSLRLFLLWDLRLHKLNRHLQLKLAKGAR